MVQRLLVILQATIVGTQTNCFTIIIHGFHSTMKQYRRKFSYIKQTPGDEFTLFHVNPHSVRSPLKTQLNKLHTDTNVICGKSVHILLFKQERKNRLSPFDFLAKTTFL